MVLCLQVSLGTWGPEPVMYQLFAIQYRRSFLTRKNEPEMGQALTSQARPQDTHHLRPSNLATRTLSLVEHTLSKFCCDSCPVKRGLVAAVTCFVRKARFLLRRQRPEMTHHKALFAGFSRMKGKPVLFSVFRSFNRRPKLQGRRGDQV